MISTNESRRLPRSAIAALGMRSLSFDTPAGRGALQILAVSAFFAAWEFAVQAGWVSAFLVGAPSGIWQILRRLVSDGSLAVDTGYTVAEAMLGFLIGSAVGSVAGLALWYSAFVARLVEPFIVAINSVPKIALAPIVILWFGTGLVSKVALAVSLTAIVALIAAYQAAKDADQDLQSLLFSMGAGKTEIFYKIVVPSTLPSIISTFRINIGFGLVGAVVGEFISSQRGARPHDLCRVKLIRPQYGMGRHIFTDAGGIPIVLRHRFRRTAIGSVEDHHGRPSASGLRHRKREKAMQIINRLSRFFLLTAALAGLAAPAAAATKVVISQAFQSMLYLPFYVAMNEDFFAEQGLEVVKETAGSGSVALSAVISGAAQFSIHGPEWTAIAASKGAPVGVIANVVNGAAVWIAAAPDFKYESVEDFKGEKVVTGMMPTTSTSLFMKLLAEAGLDPQRDVEMIQVAIGSEPGPFMAGQAKVAVMYEPGLDQVAAQGMKVILGFPALYGPYAFSTVSARKDVDAQTAQAVANAMEKAMRFMHSDPERAMEIAKAEFPNLPAPVVEAAVKRMIEEGVYPQNVDISPAALKVALDTQIALGNLAAQPDYATFVAKQYIDAALAMN